MKGQKISGKRRIILIIFVSIVSLINLVLFFYQLKLDVIIKEHLPLFKNNEILLVDEFNVYANDTILYDVTQFPEHEVDYSDNKDAVTLMKNETLTERRFDFLMQEEQMNILGLETMRGIKIASSIDELVDAYSGVECLVTNADGEPFYLLTTDLEKPKYIKKTGGTYELRMTSCYIRGEYWDRKKVALSTTPLDALWVQGSTQFFVAIKQYTPSL